MSIFGSYKLFKQLVRKYKPLGLIPDPYKYFFNWRKSLAKDASSVKDELPWITFFAIDYLQKNIEPGFKVYEFGGGGSTLFFLKHKTEVYTVEHNAEWFEILNKTITKKGYKNWNGFFIEGEKPTTVDQPLIDNPLHYATDDEFYKSYNFKSYSTSIDKYNNEFFDVVLVDGRARPSCIYHSLSKIKKNGLLVLDNSDRAYYLKQTLPSIDKEFTKVLSGYSPCPYNNDFTHTTIWIKNK